MLLAVLLASPGPAGRACSVQLWCRRNWHWYLKCEQPWADPGGSLHMRWDEELVEASSRLHMCCGNGLLSAVSFGACLCICQILSAAGTQRIP